jgi:predicted TIM-barrel fold metal-dependent hydrolase
MRTSTTTTPTRALTYALGAATFGLMLAAAPQAAAQAPPPILDVHLHALPADGQGPPPLGICMPFPEWPVWDQREPYAMIFQRELKNPKCDNPIWSPTTDSAMMAQTLEILERRNIFALVSGTPTLVPRWVAAAPHRLTPSLAVGGGANGAIMPSVAEARDAFTNGPYRAMGEVSTQYAGILPTDERLAPYWALAEELDIPVGIHVGTGPPGVIYMGAPGYRARMHSPLTMEEVLIKHPSLRVYLMHAGWPMVDELLALLYSHPQVHVDVGVIAMMLPRAEFHGFLSRIVAAGFHRRILFGSDQMQWPGGIERAIDAVETAPFLSAAQKRDIFYHNAARFLRLSDEEIARHHRGGRD